jgi:uncharacterized membrane protein
MAGVLTEVNRGDPDQCRVARGEIEKGEYEERRRLLSK